MSLLLPEEWTPVGVDSLEPAADIVVRSDSNSLVVAGPGAGKTELLAQRACYLLETGSCPAPRRILAICFKRDAAKNLGDRVRRRCGDRAVRFDSSTLDAFAKGLVDRFLLGLPSAWRPRPGYEVRTAPLHPQAMREWIRKAGVPAGSPVLDVQSWSDSEVRSTFDKLSHGHPLPYGGAEVTDTTRFLGLRWWAEQLTLPSGNPSLSFPMLNRLAAFLLRASPKLLGALRATYAYVFLDEFQDTTAAQYDLVRTAFQASQAKTTAVGDSKQRIMVWAGAMQNAFDIYQMDFSASKYYLLRNYRSAPELVLMQGVIAEALEAGTPVAHAARTNTTGSCEVLEFENPEREAEHLAALIDLGIRADARRPRDFCVLVRQQTSAMIEPLKGSLAARGIRLRDESQLQDLLSEPVARFLLATLRLATRQRDAEAWDVLTGEVAALFGLSESEESAAIEREATRLLRRAREALEDQADFERLLPDLVAIPGASAFRSLHRQYARGSFLGETVSGLAKALQLAWGSAQTARGAIDEVVGFEIVPAMTIHKSKGLEFHTVIFLGLEDSQWWNFAAQPDEEKRGFFVAFSRAAARVLFTFCDLRDERWGRRYQHRARIGDLYDILQQAGVPTVDCRNGV